MIEPIGSDNRRPGASWARYQSLYNQTSASQAKASLYQEDPETGLAAPQRVVQNAGKGSSNSVKNDLLQQGGCRSCAERQYVDGSDDPGVSMKSPTTVSAQGAAAAVISHEQEHVSRNADKAEQEGAEVVSSDVQIHTGICAECGKTYVAGGTTTTVTEKKQPATERNGTFDIRA